MPYCPNLYDYLLKVIAIELNLYTWVYLSIFGVWYYGFAHIQSPDTPYSISKI